MNAILDAIRQEREQLLAPIRDKLNRLDELEALASGLDGNGTAAGAATDPHTPAASPGREDPPPPTPPRARADAGGQPTEKREGQAGVLWALEQLGEATARQIAELTKTRLETVEAQCRTMLTAGKLRDAGLGERPSGNTNGRRPRKFAVALGAPRSSDVSKRVLKELKREDQAPANGNDRQEPTLEGRILGDLAYLPNTPAGVARRLSLDPAEVARWMRKLESDGEIAKRPDGAYAVRVQGGGADIVGNPRDVIVQIVEKVGGWVTKAELAYQLRRRGIEAPNLEELVKELQVAGRLAVKDDQVSVDMLARA